MYLIPPGSRFEPPDIHTGEEVYFLLKGTLTIFNPQTGDVHEVHTEKACGFLKVVGTKATISQIKL
jgi:hypothetical protein